MIVWRLNFVMGYNQSANGNSLPATHTEYSGGPGMLQRRDGAGRPAELDASEQAYDMRRAAMVEKRAEPLPPRYGDA
jgi:hypothetical protein